MVEAASIIQWLVKVINQERVDIWDVIKTGGKRSLRCLDTTTLQLLFYAYRNYIEITKPFLTIFLSICSIILQYFFSFQNVDDWNFDIFSFAKAAKGSPLIYLGKQFTHIWSVWWFIIGGYKSIQKKVIKR